MQELYMGPNYQLGDDMNVTPAEKAKAEKEIRRMRRSLKSWLKFRQLNNAAAAGRVKARVPASVIAQTLPMNRDWEAEQKLALSLHALLSEIFDNSKLPNPDVMKDPDAAVKLAKIAISGKLPSETNNQAQGLIWLWPAVIVVGLVLVTIITKISSDADVAKEKERLECIKIGACTDSGFWLKIGGMAMVGWFVWEKMGVGARISKAIKK